jgi:hypothetical protein
MKFADTFSVHINIHCINTDYKWNMQHQITAVVMKHVMAVLFFFIHRYFPTILDASEFSCCVTQCD